jgi:hypothetical protein
VLVSEAGKLSLPTISGAVSREAAKRQRRRDLELSGENQRIRNSSGNGRLSSILEENGEKGGKDWGISHSGEKNFFPHSLFYPSLFDVFGKNAVMGRNTK